MVLSRLLRDITYFLLLHRWKNSATLKGSGIIFSRLARISLTFGATNHNITLHKHCKISGTLAACRDGIIEINAYSQIGPNSVIQSAERVYIGSHTAISRNVTISDNNSHPLHPEDRRILQTTKAGSIERSWLVADSAPIKIGNCCWIGENSRICKGVTIGDGSIVAASSVVTKDVPPNCIVAGNPARVVKTDIDKGVRRLPL